MQTKISRIVKLIKSIEKLFGGCRAVPFKIEFSFKDLGQNTVKTFWQKIEHVFNLKISDVGQWLWCSW